MPQTYSDDAWLVLYEILNDCAGGGLSAEELDEGLRDVESSAPTRFGRFWTNYDILALNILCRQCRAELHGLVGGALQQMASEAAQTVSDVLDGREAYEYGLVFGPEGEAVDYSHMPPEVTTTVHFLEEVVEAEISGSGSVSKRTVARLYDLFGRLSANNAGETVLRNQCRAVLPGGIYEGFLSRGSMNAVIDTLDEKRGLAIGSFRSRRYLNCKGQFWGTTSLAVSVAVRGAITAALIEPIDEIADTA